MSATCPNGHQSSTTDWCDVCGAAMEAPAPEAAPDPDASPPPSAPPAPLAAAPSEVPCPHCGVGNPVDALFCEGCGYDFTTGQLPPTAPSPAPATDAPADWALDVDVDPAWYAANGDSGGVELPGTTATRSIPLRGGTALVGRTSSSRGIHPDIDCSSVGGGPDDTAVSRRHCQLIRNPDGMWHVVDLGSTNGTYVRPAGATTDPERLAVGVPRRLGDGDQVLLGAWTRLTLRHVGAPPASGAS